MCLMPTGGAASFPGGQSARKAIRGVMRPPSAPPWRSSTRSILLTDVETMDSIVERAETGKRFSLLPIAAFAAIAALLAGVGLYGVLATVVRQRTAEIGIRMTLGAQSGNIFQLIVGQGVRLTGIGVVVGLLAAFATTREMASMLVGIKATDPLTFVTMAVVFFLIAAISSW